MSEIAKIIIDKRESLGKSQQEVADITKVRLSVIKDIENGDFEKLPPVYGVSHLKMYLKYLKISEDEVAAELEDISKKHKQQQNKNINKSINNLKVNKGVDKPTLLNPISLTKPGANKTQLYIVLLIVIIGIAVAIYLSFFNIDSRSSIIDISPKTLDTASLSDKKGLMDYFDGGGGDSLILEAFSIDECWLKVNIDGKKEEEILMTANMKRRWGATSYFIVNQGNVGAVQFSRNGTLLEPFGTKGTVVKNVKITKEKVAIN